MALSARAGRTLGRALRLLGARRRRAAWTTALIAAVVLLVGVARLIEVQVEAWAGRWRGGAAMVVYLGEGVALDRAAVLTEELAALPGVVRAELVPPDEAARRLRAALGRAEALLDGVDAEALPATVELVLEPGARDVVAASPLLAALRAADAVEDVELDGAWADPLAATLRGVRALVATLALLFAGLAALVVLGAVRLGLAEDAAGASERHVARLLGAGPAYLLGPSLLAGALLGVVGAGLGLAALRLALARGGAELAAPLARALGDGTLASVSAIGWPTLVAAAAAIGALGGLLAGARRDVG